MTNFLPCAAAIFAFISGVLWIVACFVRVRYRPRVDADGWEEGSITHDGNDFLRTARLQTAWNAAGAFAAALSAFCQLFAARVGP